MKDYNKFVVVGRLAADPEMSYTPSGMALTKLNVASANDKYDKAKEEWVQNTNWFRVTFFGERAENVARLYMKGDKVIVEASVQSVTFESDGHKVSTFNFSGDTISMLIKKPRDGEQQQPRQEKEPVQEPVDEDTAPW